MVTPKYQRTMPTIGTLLTGGNFYALLKLRMVEGAVISNAALNRCDRFTSASTTNT
jgi:hypothetical protein